MAHFLAVVIAVFLDRLFGELPVYHPFTAFTRFATYIEDQWHRQKGLDKHVSVPEAPAAQDAESKESAEKAEKAAKADQKAERAKGIIATVTCVIPFVALTAMIVGSFPVPLNFVLNTFILYLTLGAHTLKQHALDVQQALITENLELARKHLMAIISRDTKQMDRQDIITVCVDSILENGSEMVLAPIFWYVIGGSPAAVLYTLVHILNNIWVLEHRHYENFGLAAKRTNAVLGWVPARIAGFSYILLGDMKNGWNCFNTQTKSWKSPNRDVLLATGGGALNLELEKDTAGQEQDETKPVPVLGQGKLPDLSDIARALDLTEKCLVFWLVLILMASFGH